MTLKVITATGTV